MAEPNKKQLLSEFVSNLNTLREQEARYGGQAPVALLNRIEDFQQAIDLTEQVLTDRISEEQWQEGLKPLTLSLPPAADFTEAAPSPAQQSYARGPAQKMAPMEQSAVEQSASFAQQAIPEPVSEPAPPPEFLARLSNSAQEAVRVAAGLAWQSGQAEIVSEWLLVGLYRNENSSARAVLTAFGWPPDNFFRWVNRLQQGNTQLTAVGLENAAGLLNDDELRNQPLSRNVSRILEQAGRLAGERGTPRVRSRHLLQALLEVGLSETDPGNVPEAFNWLDELGVPAKTVRDILAGVAETAPITAAMFTISASSAFADTAATQDRLGFELHAQALAEIIVKPETIPPVVIGIYGPWGSGKSTFMTLVKKHLDGWDRRQHPQPGYWQKQRIRLFGQPRQKEVDDSPRVICVEYNAWAYTDSEKLWAGLVEKISPYLDEQIPVIKKPLFWFRRNSRRFAWALLVGLSPFAVGLAAWGLVNWLFSLSGEVGAQTVTAIVTLALSALGSLRNFAAQKPLTDAVSTLLKDYDAEEVKGVMGTIQDEFQQTVKDYFVPPGDGGKKPAEGGTGSLGKLRQNRLKVVVMIDELDRCPLEKIVDILEGIKIFLAEEIFIVLMAVDTRVIAESVRLHYKDVNNPNLAREYLEKIIQIPIQVPAADPRQLASFVTSLMEIGESADDPGAEAEAGAPGPAGHSVATEGGPVTVADPSRAPLVVSETLFNPLQLDDTATEQKAITAFAINYLDSNPRRIKRLLNTYRFVKILATRRGERTDQIEWQQKMINWLGLTMRWPSFMAGVVRHEPPPATPQDYEALAEQWRDDLPDGHIPPLKLFQLPLPTGAQVARFELLADNFIVESPSEAIAPGE
ncbi:MAG: hypothetical protein Kow0031_00360 [Anaerolineae bacterium]